MSEPDNLPAKTFKAASPRKPVTKLDARGRRLIDLMTGGFDDETEAASYGLPAYEPLSLEQAAAPAGLRRSNARFLFTQPIFLKTFNENLAAYRNGSKALAVKTMINVMQDAGENSAADRRVRLQAAQALTGDAEGRGGTQVNLSINNAPTLVAGIVVRLPSDAAATPLEHMSQETGEIIDIPPTSAKEFLEEKISYDPSVEDSLHRSWPHTGGADD